MRSLRNIVKQRQSAKTADFPWRLAERAEAKDFAKNLGFMVLQTRTVIREPQQLNSFQLRPPLLIAPSDPRITELWRPFTFSDDGIIDLCHGTAAAAEDLLTGLVHTWERLLQDQSEHRFSVLAEEFPRSSGGGLAPSVDVYVVMGKAKLLVVSFFEGGNRFFRFLTPDAEPAGNLVELGGAETAEYFNLQTSAQDAAQAAEKAAYQLRTPFTIVSFWDTEEGLLFDHFDPFAEEGFGLKSGSWRISEAAHEEWSKLLDAESQTGADQLVAGEVPKSAPLTGIVIPSWNQITLTQQCIASIRRLLYRNYLVIAVDNGSTDGVYEWLQSCSDVLLIRNKRNLGFAKAVNQGIERALAEGCRYVALINNDVVLDSDWLSRIIQHLEANPQTGFAQGSSLIKGTADKLDSSGIYIDTSFTGFQRGRSGFDPRTEQRAIGPNAAGAVYRHSLLEGVRLREGEYFRNIFFAYYEDVDLDLRAALRGFRFAYVPSAKLEHVTSASAAVFSTKKTFRMARNLVWVIYLNAPPAILQRTWPDIKKRVRLILTTLWPRQKKEALSYLLGLAAGIAVCPFLRRERKRSLERITLADEEYLKLLQPLQESKMINLGERGADNPEPAE